MTRPISRRLACPEHQSDEINLSEEFVLEMSFNSLGEIEWIIHRLYSTSSCVADRRQTKSTYPKLTRLT